MIRAVLAAVVLACGVPHHHHHHARPPHTLFPSLHITVPTVAPSPSETAPPTQTDTTPDAAPPAPPPPSYPTRTGVDEGEYYVHLAHMTLAAGAVELNLHNFGMDDHDVTIDDANGNVVAQLYLVAGAQGQLTPTLAAGTYKVYCSLYGGTHDQAGMHATLTVK